MSICIDARMAFASGIGVAIRNLIPIWAAFQFKITVLVNKQELLWENCAEQIIIKSPIYSIQEQWELPLKIPECDLFWSPHYNIPLVPIRAKKRIVTIHDVCHLVFSRHLSLPEKIYAKMMLNAAYRTADIVIANSAFTKSELEKYLGRRKSGVRAIHMGIDARLFQKVEDLHRLEKVRQKHHLPDAFILFVGNLKPHKNLARLIQAFSQTHLPNWKLVLVGKFQGLRNSVELSNHQGVIQLHDVLDEELPVLYTLARLFVLPSLYEGFGLPPLEAMCCGCPTVVSNAASVPEVCGEASMYFHPEKIDEMARVIQEVSQNEELQNQLILKGYNRIKSFDWQRTAEEYKKVFEQAL